MDNKNFHINAFNTKKRVEMGIVEIDNEPYYKISNHDTMRPFFMSIVSDSDHWMFISSNGGLSAGRKNPNYALFPYYTDDKITESFEITGSKSIFQVELNGEICIWEPFSERFGNRYLTSRNLYKNFFGNKIIFEEQNHDLGLVFRYHWKTSSRYGFIKQNELINLKNDHTQIRMLDGIQNILPYGVEKELQNAASNLVDAYKRNELEKEFGLGIYSLSAIIVDKAEPSEALKANIAWCLGVENPSYLVSSLQLDSFRKGNVVFGEFDVKGEKGAYFVCSDMVLAGNSVKRWKIVSNVNQNHSQILSLCREIKENKDLEAQVEHDIKTGTQNLIQLVVSADGLQITANQRKNTRHFSNVLFNIMRGGIFDNNYQIEKADFLKHISNANRNIVKSNNEFFEALKPSFSLTELKTHLQNCNDTDLIRLSIEYLPLKFSRRHGDPSRPWNSFSINTVNETDGSKILDYEGNWRDLFQNWEALVHSYPEFIEGMLYKFLNASTFDGYNPYRIAKDGFDWETIEPDNPWSYIGYWGDHQIIYLLKFLEFFENHQPNELDKLFNCNSFVYANVPYRIKPYSDIAKDPKNTIRFDAELDHAVRQKIADKGADGALLASSIEEIHHVTFIEKILATLLSKVSNYIPEGGIWMNTQRPEWNDANNALVGNGVSMVTLYYLYRFLRFFESKLAQTRIGEAEVSEELFGFFVSVLSVLDESKQLLSGKINDTDRKRIADALGWAGSNYRELIYSNGFSGKKASLKLSQVEKFVAITLRHFAHTINANQRADKLYHAYNLLTISEKGMSVSRLSEMLEGQVAALSSGHLSAAESEQLLRSLRNSSLYRKDQNSYMLYPNKELPRFFEKNCIPSELVENSELLKKLISDGNLQIINQDINGGFHFNGNFRNANDLRNALLNLTAESYKTLVKAELEIILGIFEKVFNHKAFTGRSGTFFSYEGLGSIYWHMVSKLHLAVYETCVRAAKNNENSQLLDSLAAYHFEIGNGIGVHKSPEEYGAFPTDPYSHTPLHRGAQQPGMTGQVKEDILARYGELGVYTRDGMLHFNPFLLRKDEFITESRTIECLNIKNEPQHILLEKNSLIFTYCQVPVVYTLSEKEGLVVEFNNGKRLGTDSLNLDQDTSQQIFRRTGLVKQINVSIQPSRLKGNML